MDLELLYQQCLIIAKELVENKKREFSCVELFAFDDPPAPPANESTDNMLYAYAKNYPGLIEATRKGILPLAQENLRAAQATSQPFSQLQFDLVNQFAPGLTSLGNRLNQQTALANAGSDLAVVQGPGRQLVQEAVNTQKIADPEFYQNRALAGNQLANLLRSVNLSGFTPTERRETQAEIDRQNIQRGTFGSPNQLSTTQNAMQFGSALQGKRNALANILGTAGQVMPSMRSGTDVFQVATGRSSMPNFGQAQFVGAQKNDDNANTQLAGNLLGQIGGLRQQEVGINAQRKGTFEKMVNWTGQVASGCCFIFMESYNGVLPWFVRRIRDDYYKEYPQAAKGYKRMAKVLVPLMERFTPVKDLVNELMIKPLTQFGGYVYSVEGFEEGKHKTGFVKFWLKTWSIIGKF